MIMQARAGVLNLALPAVLLVSLALGAPASQAAASRAAAGAGTPSAYAAAMQVNGSPCNPSPIGTTSLLGLNPGSPVVYALTKSGLYRVDTGATAGWQLRNANIGAISSLAPAANDANDVLFLRKQTILRSTDGGATLATVGPAPTSQVFDLSRAAGNPTTLYALSAAGDSVGDDTVGGLYRSNDTEITWTQVYTGGTNPEGANQLSAPVIAPSDPWTVALDEDAYHGGGINLSTDGGQTWGGLGDNESGFDLLAPTTFAFNPANARDVWVEYQSWQGYPGGVLVRTTDAGNTWTHVPYGMPAYPDVRAIAVDPRGPVYVTVAGKATGAPNPLFVAPDATHFVRLLPSGNPNVGHQLALVSVYTALLTWDDEHPLWAIATHRPAGLDPLKNAAAAPAGSVYLAATHHAIAPLFLKYYQQHGGLRAFGLPLSEAVIENGQSAQYFERARLAITSRGVAPSALGSLVCTGHIFPPVPAVAGNSARRYFPATGHTLSGRFLAYWQQHEGSLLLGAPISEPFHAQNGDGTGRTYLLQYFTNGRLEYHPELGGGHDVSLGLVGSEYLHRAGLR
jgi:hypothetical protein